MSLLFLLPSTALKRLASPSLWYLRCTSYIAISLYLLLPFPALPCLASHPLPPLLLFHCHAYLYSLPFSCVASLPMISLTAFSRVPCFSVVSCLELSRIIATDLAALASSCLACPACFASILLPFLASPYLPSPEPANNLHLALTFSCIPYFPCLIYRPTLRCPIFRNPSCLSCIATACFPSLYHCLTLQGRSQNQISGGFHLF